MWNGSTWAPFTGAVSELSLTGLGIGTPVDGDNPFSAKLNSALFAALPTSSAGSGDIRAKLSKQAAGNTATFLFQDNYSGRAEIGLAGDDDFHFKVSADGSTWYDAIDIAASSGTVSFLDTPTFPTASAGDNSTKGAHHGLVDAALAEVTARTQVSDAAYSVLASDRTVAIIALTAPRILTLPGRQRLSAGRDADGHRRERRLYGDEYDHLGSDRIGYDLRRGERRDRGTLWQFVVAKQWFQ